MLVWGLVCGAIIGWFASYWGFAGFVLGGLLGLGAGAWLRHAIRREIAEAVAKSTEMSAPPAMHEPAPPPSPAVMPQAMPEPPSIPREPPKPADAPIVRARPAAPLPPPRRTAADERILAAWNWAVGGNTIVRVGLVILFIGLTFLARYAASIGLFPLELRLSLVAVAGVVLLAIGFRKRDAKPAFARALQGTGVAVLYLTVFTSARLFDLIPIVPAFAFMILFCALGCALALMQNSQSMALAAFAGGFAVPILLGGKSEMPIVPFSYYTMLNLAILTIAWQRSWRPLNLLGFFATFGAATLWGMLNYTPSHYAVAQIFLIASILIYLATAILYAHNTPGKLGNLVDSTLLFGPALAGFGLQAGLVRHFEFGSAFSALGFGSVYVALAATMMRRDRAAMRLMIECMIAIGVGFITLAIPLALDVNWTSSAWALEGAGAFWVGMRQARWMPRLFGLLLQFVAAFIFLVSLDGNVSGIPFANPGFLGGMLIAAPMLWTAWWLRSPLPHSGSSAADRYAEIEIRLQELLFLAGFLFGCIAFGLEACRALPPVTTQSLPTPVFAPGMQRLLVMLAVLAAMWGATRFGRKHGWAVATWPGRASLPVIGIVFLAQSSSGDHMLYTPDWAFWLAALGLHVLLVRDNDTADEAATNETLRTWHLAVHVITVWLVTAIVGDCLTLGIDRAKLWDTSWAGVVFLISAIAVLFTLTRWAGRASASHATGKLRWPLDPHALGYYWIAALPIAVLTYFGALSAAMFAAGETRPLPYLPLFNPVDLTLGLALAVLALWRRMIAGADTPPVGSVWLRGRVPIVAGAVLAFAIANGIWLRTAHHWLGVGWNLITLMDSFVVQTGLAILWTLLAMSLMLFAHRRGGRTVWMTGAALLGVVVTKLILVDLSNAGGWERIVTFTVVGALMLVIGYFAPLPPRKATASDRDVAA